MKLKNSFTLSWCEKHKNWWVTNCPDCMVDVNEADIKKDGIREVVDELEEIFHSAKSEKEVWIKVRELTSRWQAKLKSWGLSNV